MTGGGIEDLKEFTDEQRGTAWEPVLQSAYKTVMDWWVYHTAVLPTLAEIAQAFQQTRKQAAACLPQGGADLAPAVPLPAPRARAYAASGAAIVAEGAAKACLAVRPQVWRLLNQRS